MWLRIGTSAEADVDAAISAAARGALSRSRAPVLGLVFSTFDYAPEAVAAAANRELGEVPWAGIVTQAILAGDSVIPRGVAVGVIESDRVRVRVRMGAAGPMSADARGAGRRAAREALSDMPLPPADRSRAVLLFSETEQCDAAEAVHGALSVAGAGIAWCGGGTRDLEGRGRAAQYAHGRAFRDHVVAVALDCPLRVGVGIQHGWEPTGPPAMVTRATGCLIERLEHRPAFEIYRDAAEEGGEPLTSTSAPDDPADDDARSRIDAERFARFAARHPLGVPQANREYLIRDPLAVDDSGALRFTASVPEGALVRVMEGTPSMLIEAARTAASMARADAGGKLGGALVFDCISRSVTLGERLHDELAACHAALGGDVPVLGCLTFGEVGAFGARMPQFHNKTMVVVGLPAR